MTMVIQLLFQIEKKTFALWVLCHMIQQKQIDQESNQRKIKNKHQ